MSTSQPTVVVVPRTVVTVKLFSQDGEPAGLIEVAGDLPDEQALTQALCAICKYLMRHVYGKSPHRIS